jgi:hypothetical protein
LHDLIGGQALLGGRRRISDRMSASSRPRMRSGE